MIDHNFYHPLYDTLDGGPARAFVCKWLVECSPAECGHITKTERGMLEHLRIAHKIVLQLDIDKPTGTE